MSGIAVVFGCYRLPEERLQAHLEWNASFYSGSGARLFVVTDREYPLPPFAECVVFPEENLPLVGGVRRFATTRCRNAGIRAAIAAGCGLITCTDVDISFEPEAWEAALAVGPCGVPTAAVPYCRMSESSEWARRERSWIDAEFATGTVTMTADQWRVIQYDESQHGYGYDDSRMLHRIAAQGVSVLRTGYVYHVAHVDGANQKEHHGRNDHWNRANGFNPQNFRHNRRRQ